MADTLAKTIQYKEAFEALSSLKRSLGTTPELKAIALFLLYASECSPSESQFPFTGTSDPRDMAVVQAYSDAWERLIAGED